jgi:MraZ protein
MDNKGRVMIPAALKKQLAPVLDSGFVVKRSVFQKCLELYTMTEWNEMMAKVNGLNRFVKKNNDFIRMFTAGVKVVELDGTGRLNISNDLIAFAGLSSDIVMSSAVSMIEIWDKNAYEQTLNNPDIDFGALAEDVMGNANTPGDGLS